MKVIDTAIDGVKVIELQRHRDERGWFMERFNARAFKEAGLPHAFVQDNHSFSKPNVLRGLHYQHNPTQGKLVGVLRGAIWDVAVDVRVASPTYSQHVAVELSAENGRLLWVPGGMAHGFCVLGEEEAEVFYKVDSHYNAKGEGGIRWDDPDLGIVWPLSSPIVSEKDAGLPSWNHYARHPVREWK
ncbi:dTDP-4-dehydrorhamnose 3,5-epimerase [bacterium]|nr:dTDP-4-dehydrorhamnose 3,5-epimerase [bacterium]